MKTINLRQTIILAALATVIFVGFYSGSNARAHPTPTPTPTASPVSVSNENIVAETNPEPMSMTDEFPNYHPLVVHFPIVLLIFAAVFQILSFFMYRKEFGVAVLIMILVGAISAWLASNVFHAHPKDLAERASEIFETHELMAQLTFWFALAALVAKTISHFVIKRKWWSEAIVFLFLLAASITVSIAGHHGSELVHIEGVGPQGKYLEHKH